MGFECVCLEGTPPNKVVFLLVSQKSHKSGYPQIRRQKHLGTGANGIQAVAEALTRTFQKAGREWSRRPLPRRTVRKPV